MLNLEYTYEMQLNGKVFGRFLLFILFIFFSFKLLFTPQPWIVLDGANLLFHEAGHLIFLPFGQFAHMIGGSLFQILLPCIFLFYFLYRYNFFASSVILFWIGDNIINVSVYMKDAQAMQLPLLIEGTFHDWNWIFSQLGILWASNIVGGIFYYVGAICLIISLTGMVLFILVDEN